MAAGVGTSCSGGEVPKQPPRVGGLAPSVGLDAGADELKKIPAAQPAPSGECSVFSNQPEIFWSLEFPKHAATIPEDQLETLKKVAQSINKRRLRVEVEGHADPSESDPGLSLARAKNVVEQMVRFGTEPDRLIVVDKGASPAPESIEQNSRVSFNVVGLFRPCD